MIVQEKKALRRNARADMRIHFSEDANRRIQALVREAPEYQAARKVCCYISVGYEIDTRFLLEQIMLDGKELLVPRCRAQSMDACKVENRTGLQRILESRSGDFHGIPQPGDEAFADEPDLCILPCLLCTPKGVRLGQGGGYYDRYLAHRKVRTLLLYRPWQLVEDLPEEETDIPIQVLLSENGFFRPYMTDETEAGIQ